MIIRPSAQISLNDQILAALQKGIKKIYLDGHFAAKENQFSLLTITHNLEIEAKGKPIIDGKSLANHVIFIADGIKVRIKGLKITGGDTRNMRAQLSLKNHPKTPLNLFRYLDGGAITLGEGSELVLENCELEDNHSAICAGAISNLGGFLLVKNSTFKNNSCGDTGAAIDNLARGSLSIVEKCKFQNNKANLIGGGNYGAITAFPDTFLCVKDSDFSEELTTAIDFKPNKNGQEYITIDDKTKLSKKIVKKPLSNKGVFIKTWLSFLKIFMTHPLLIKFEDLPTTKRDIIDKHHRIFSLPQYFVYSIT